MTGFLDTQAKYVNYIRLFYSKQFNQVLLSLLLDGKRQRTNWHKLEECAEVLAQDGFHIDAFSHPDWLRASIASKNFKTILKKKRNSNENSAKQQHPNRLVRKPPLHRSPKFARSHQPSLENLSDGISADETIPDGKPKPKQTGRRDGVGRALVRRITGMVVTGKSDEERNDNFKTKSFAKDFKLGPLFRKEAKDDDAEVKKDDINLKRRPATLGLPKACS